MKVWITKYALTRGIFEMEVEIFDGELVYGKEPWIDFYCGEGREWNRTKEAAINKAEKIRQKKISGLKKQIKKLEGMRFE